MKISTATLAFSIFCSSTVLAHQTEAQCKNGVEATLQAIEIQTQQKDETQKLKDLSTKDIKELQKTKGHCEAMRQINMRTMN